MDSYAMLVALLDFCALLISFLSLCIVCDEHLVPTVEVFIVQFEVPEEVAAVTLVAFGSAAPELFLNSVSAVAQTSDLSMAAILGSGIIAFGLIPPLCILSANPSQIKLKLYPIIRECSFYLLGLFVFLASIKDGKLASYEAGLLIVVYLCYTGIVAFMYFRAKAAAHATDYAALPTTDDVNTEGVRLHSPINRSITESSAVHSAPLAPLSVSPTSLDVDFPSSPTGRCRFFPTLSRSTSDLTRLRRTGKGNNEQSPRSGAESPVQMQNGSKRSSPNGLLNNSNGGASAGDVSSGSGGGGGGGEDGYGDSEQASLLVDDVEAFTAGIDASGSGSDDPASVNNSAEERPLHAIVLRAFHAVYSPIRHVIRSLLPSLHPQVPHFISGDGGTMSGNRNPVVGSSTHVPLRRAALVLACCILAIGVNAVSIVIFCESVIAHLGFSSTAMGATLVALGAEIPDTVSAVALARSGYYNAAMAGAIGSQVINVSLGVGVPALLVCIFGDGFLRISQPQTASLVLLTCLLIVVILSYITVTVPIAKLLARGQWASNTLVSKPGAMFQLGVWVLTYVTFLHFNKGDPEAVDSSATM